MPQERGGGLEEDTGTGNMGCPNLGKEKGWNSEQKCLWEAGEELGCLAGVPELRLGCRAALEGVSRERGYGRRVDECQVQCEGGAERELSMFQTVPLHPRVSVSPDTNRDGWGDRDVVAPSTPSLFLRLCNRGVGGSGR